ncbi:MAG: sigma-70 family RNA polymerase sigma factor [Planctomycetes bacterium]|nr:sigma-70 family RNA polymerase sigma factor [Planctomycetota bacterium]
MESTERRSALDPSRPEDWLALCDELSPALYAWAKLRLKTFGFVAVAPEDVVQETWLRALAGERRDGTRCGGALRGWLFGIARNVLLEHSRAHSARSLRESRLARAGESASELIARCEDSVTSVCSRLERDETLARFFEFADALDAADRALLLGCGFEGATATEVGRRFDLAPDTAIKRWQRLRDALRTRAFAQRIGLSD